MRILSISIKNLNSLKIETRIALDEEPIATSGLFAITGDTGAGKTTILDAISLALYGRVHRNKDVKEVMSYGASECYAEIEFSSKDEKYRAKWNIWRARGKSEGNILGPNRELAQWNKEKNEFEIIAEKIREVDEKVEEITGLDYDRFSRSVVLSQGDFAAFLKAGEKERSDLLERITGTEIYSEISKAAFEKHKIEKDKLEDLQKEQTLLQVLDKESLKELKDNLKELSTSAKGKKSKIDSYQQQIQWLKNIEKLNLRKLELEEIALKIENEKETIKVELERLSLHQKTLPFQNKIEKIDDLKQQNDANTLELEQLKGTGLQLQQKEQSTLSNLELIKNALSILKQEMDSKSDLIEVVMALDIEIKAKEDPFLKTKTSFDKSQKQILQKQQKAEELKKNLDLFQKEKITTQDWLDSNKHLKSIVEDLPKIDQHYETLRLEYRKKEEGKSSQNDLEKQLKELENQKTKLDKSILSANKDLDKILSTFKSTVPENFVHSRSDLLNKLTAEIDQLSNSNKNLQQLRILNDQYQILLTEFNQYEEKLENLKQEQDNVDKRVFTAMETVDNLNSILEYKQQIYDQQNLISNYAKDRSNLKEGDPCPLCFSETHPFRGKKFKPYVDQANKELQQTKTQHSLVYGDYKKLLNRQLEVKNQIENLAGNEGKAISGEVKNQYEKIIQFEGQITKIAPELAAEDFALARKSIINRKIIRFEKELKELQSTREKLIKLDTSLAQHELKVKTFETEKTSLDLNLVKIQEQHKLFNKQLTDSEENFKSQKEALNNILKAYNKSFDIKTGKETKAYLETLKSNFENKQKQQQDLNNQIDLANQEFNQVQQQIEELQTSANVLSTEIESTQKEIDAAKEKRIQLFGTDDPKVFKSQLQLKINDSSTQNEEANILWNNTKLSLQTNTTQIKEIEKQVTRDSQTLEKLNTVLSKTILKNGFQTIQEVKDSILSETEAESIQTQSDQLKTKTLEYQQDLKTTTTDLKKETAKKLTEEDLEALILQLSELDDSFQEAQQKIGALNEKLEQNNQRKQQVKNF